MKHLPSDKYNVAWFKLAECVARGEKEKALGVYRLLVHSLEEPAFIRQLEGDLLLAFKDNAAIEKYIIAAELYQKSKKYFEAAAVYEHILMLVPDSDIYATKLVELYQLMGLAEIELHQRMVLVLLGLKDIPQALVAMHLKKALDVLADSSDKDALTIFLAKVQALDSRYHERALQLLKNE